MSDSTQSPSFNISSAQSSSLVGVYDDIETIRTKNYVKELLKSRIFLGRYLERRLVNTNVGYRDVVLISAAETDLKRDLLDAQIKLHSISSNQWIGITDTDSLGYNPPGICLWTEIDNQPFGPFWFQIKTIRFRDQEVIVCLKCLRHISEAFLELEPLLTGGGEVKRSDTSVDKHPNNTVSLTDTYNDILGNLKDALSITNVKEFFTFIFAFIIALFTGSTAFVNFLGNFVLALIREMSIFVKNSTPVLLGVLDFFSKIVGGFYILLAMIFKQSSPGPMNKRYERQAIPYDRRSRHSSYNDNSQYDYRNFD